MSIIAPPTTTPRMLHLSEMTAATTLWTSFRFAPLPVLPPQSSTDQGKLTVVLDMDETLIHAEFLPEHVMVTKEMVDMFNAKYAPMLFCFHLNGKVVIVRKRPYLQEFLHEVSKTYEIIAFTAAQEDYATMILNHLDPTKTIFRHRLFRQHCSLDGLVKDLRVLNRNLERTVLVDNTHTSFLSQLTNGIPIESFTNDMTDQALVILAEFLTALENEPDVRVFLQKIFKLETKLMRFDCCRQHAIQ